MNTFLKKTTSVLVPVITVYILHYISANLYVKICANLGFLGFISSFLTTGSPVCNALLTIINTTHNSYSLMIAGLVGGLVTFALATTGATATTAAAPP
jgi:hypothetical protein